MSEEIRARPFVIKEDGEKRVVLGVVYAPDVRDTDGNFMTAAEIEKMAYSFMEKQRLNKIDRDHNGDAGYGQVVESFIARAGDTAFPEGAWVLGTRVTDDAAWKDIKDGKIIGYSIFGKCTLIPDVK